VLPELGAAALAYSAAIISKLVNSFLGDSVIKVIEKKK